MVKSDQKKKKKWHILLARLWNWSFNIIASVLAFGLLVCCQTSFIDFLQDNYKVQRPYSKEFICNWNADLPLFFAFKIPTEHFEINFELSFDLCLRPINHLFWVWSHIKKNVILNCKFASQIVIVSCGSFSLSSYFISITRINNRSRASKVQRFENFFFVCFYNFIQLERSSGSSFFPLT